MNKTQNLLAAALALALAFTLSCSSDDDDEGGGDVIYTYGLEDVTGSSFIMVEDEGYECKENGTLEKDYYRHSVSYSIDGKVLSIWELDFKGNSSSLTGTWTREPFTANCATDSYCDDFDGVSKLVFTSSTLTMTACIGKVGSVVESESEDGVARKTKIINCSTQERTYTKGNETVKRTRYYNSPRKEVYTYNGKTCTWTESSEAQMRTACTQAYNKVKAENPGYSGNSYLVEDEYYDILDKDMEDCMKSFPEWF